MSEIQPHIHVVDDDPSVLLALKRLLTSWGMQVQTFASGENFLSALKRPQDVDCSVIDVQMPEMTGLEVQEQMNRLGIDVPVIFITAHEEEGVEELALRAGAVGFLRKPFTDEALVDLIRIAMQCQRKSEFHET
ncbi:MAG: response regulator transcription factor [Desulfobacterales bacterium]